MRVRCYQGFVTDGVAPSACCCPFNFCNQELLKASATEVRLETRVTGVVGNARAGYSVIGGAQDKLGTFDAVVIATPLGLAGIALDVRGEVRNWCCVFTWQPHQSDEPVWGP